MVGGRVWCCCQDLFKIARNTGHCWRSKDEIVSDVLLWTPAYGQLKAGRPARTFIQQLWDDTGCNPEDLPKAMNDRETWRERVRDIRASRTSWWWWWYSSFGVCLRKVWNLFFFFFTVTAYWLLISLLESHDQSYRETLHVCFLFIPTFKWIFAETICDRKILL